MYKRACDDSLRKKKKKNGEDIEENFFVPVLVFEKNEFKNSSIYA